MKKILTAISILILMTFALSSCYVMNHTVGEGAKAILKLSNDNGMCFGD